MALVDRTAPAGPGDTLRATLRWPLPRTTPSSQPFACACHTYRRKRPPSEPSHGFIINNSIVSTASRAWREPFHRFFCALFVAHLVLDPLFIASSTTSTALSYQPSPCEQMDASIRSRPAGEIVRLEHRTEVGARSSRYSPNATLGVPASGRSDHCARDGCRS